IMASSSNNTISSKKHQKQLISKNRKTTSHLFDDVFEELQYLLNTKDPIVVVETSAINTNSSSDSDNLSLLLNTEVFTITNLEFINTQSNQSSRHDKTKCYNMGRMDQTCRYYKAKFWMIKKNQNSKYIAPKFPLCCANNKVQLLPLLKPPPYLLNLYTSTNPNTVESRKHARGYNSALAFYYLIGSLLSNEGCTPAFAQLYIYYIANEITNHQNAMQELNKNIL
ncbi:574_t:CDS:2, partial [Dentiscutata erythropus]